MELESSPRQSLKQLVAQNISKTFDLKKVVQDVSFFVEEGEIVGLLGPNGAGKTTSFYMTVGLLKPSSGHVYMGGTNITQFPLYKRARMGIGYLPQNSSVFRKLSVYENVLAAAEVCQVPSRERKEVCHKLLSQFGLLGIKNSPALALSGGERRRLEIARILVIRPRFLLLDEPFAGIDPVTVDEIQKMIKNLAESEGMGVLITDHNVRETLGVCHRAYVLIQGKILVEGNPQKIIENEMVRKVYLGENFVF
jgi:lipopolysaccharide export system ATP-binding protein